ncbi:hypothetical protein QNA08_13575 [Chelatococcus sp. SYSU_G07232]|uniref:GlsB/YeaQ/YmgE family stress response membrane protein n=1 Tax=Chelatococcus albus TaxID=3047466 RepID=A0ABT7AJH4_9HYPH|nr:hypothetical protein [Chelatococcus sp. SYSU_G07232]MDJ1159265.1 hypothetical protein [Chelatococcus sp. SYSU_G07232]
MNAMIVFLILQLIAGAIGGWVVGSLLKQYSLGHAGDAVAGLVGGVVGGWLLPALGLPMGTELTVGAIISHAVAGFISGGVLMIIVGVVRDLMTGGHKHA